MKRRMLVRISLLLALLATPAAPQDNVLVVLVDDLGIDWLGMYGLASDPPSTPNLDALAAAGVTFTNVWGSPMCSPTRAAIQTGRYSFRTGVGDLVSPSYGLPLAEKTLPEMLTIGSGATYANAFIGKWHLGSEAVGGLIAPNLAGWHHFAGMTPFAGSLQEGEDYFHWTKVTDGVAEIVDEYVTSNNVDDAIEAINGFEQSSSPWLLMVSLVSVHVPLHAPPAELHTVDLSSAGPPETDPLPYFRAMIEAMDTEIGRLLAVVDPQTTTVIFLADNGTAEPLVVPPFEPLHAKNSLFEGGIHLPLIVRGPDVAFPGSTCAALVNATDVFATVADLTGVDLEATMPAVTLDSVSFRPYLADPQLPSQREWIFAEHFRPNGPHSGPLAPAVPSEICQQDLGFGGPGTAVLSFCGPPLVEYAFADLVLSGVPPFAPAYFGISLGLFPIPFFGGILATNPLAIIVPDFANANGEVRLENLKVPSPGPVSLYVQAGALDPSILPWNVAISNAIKASYLPWDTKAIRNERWKLLADVHGGWHRLYDLQNDPLELTNLIAAGPLDTEAQAEYEALLAALEGLIDPP